MRILITGAAGMLGLDVARAAERAGHDVVALPRAELDIADAGAVDHAFAAERPDAVVNCAAWTDVDAAEADPEGALAVNGAGAGNVALAAAARGARLVHVSTDYVFDGTKSEPYVESDATAPLSSYGASKLAGERAIAEAHPGAVIARSSWLFGTGGKNFAATMLGLAAERPEVRVVTDQRGCPTWTGHLAGALLALLESESGGVRHVAGGGACTWNEFAREIFSQAGVDCRVLDATTAEMVRPATRPANSVLVSELAETPALPPWQEGLAGYLAERSALGAGLR
jgi:dTDP-4-dehydrorhamnose reductase